MQIGIIGAGIAGLTCAYELCKKGHTVDIYETAPFIGGQASTFSVRGSLLERGYHHLFLSDTYIADLIEELGLSNQLKWFESSVGLYYGGHIWKFSTPIDLLKFKPLPFLDRIRLGVWTLILQRTKTWNKFEEITAQDWIIRHMGIRSYRVIWEPLLRGKFGDYFNKISMTWVWGKIYLRVASRKKNGQKELLGYPMGSFEEIISTLSDRITSSGGNIHTNTTVEKIISQDNSLTGLQIRYRTGESYTRKYDKVVSTTPSYVLPFLAEELPQKYINILNTTSYLSAVLLILVLEKPLSDIYWLNIADRTIPFVGIIEHTNMIDNSLYGNKHIVYITNYVTKDSDIYLSGGSELLKTFIPHLKTINPDFEESWIVEYYHHKIDAAQPIVETNYSSQIPDHKTPIKGLYLGNTSQIYPEDRGTNYSVRLGKHLSDIINE
ncbi:MAG: amine oxidase [Dehalococcoidia bacterium]|nr:amine oxidase [Dehalococcoidia bacterium]